MNPEQRRAFGESFHAHLADALRRRAPGDLRLVVSLTDDPLVFRPTLSTEAAASFSLRELFQCAGAPFGRIVGFRQVLASAFQAMPAFGVTEGWGQVTVWYAAVAACRYAQRLLDQVGVGETGVFDVSRIPPEFDDLFDACIGDATGMQSAALAFADRCSHLLRAGPRRRRWPQPADTVSFVPSGGSIAVVWTAGGPEGSVLCREHLRQFVDVLTDDESWDDGAGHLARLDETRRRHAERGGDLLEAVSPRLAEAVRTALSRECRVGLRLATAAVRRTIPLSLWLYVEPRATWEGIADVTLTANRAHEEFMVRGPAPRRILRYMPPCVLVAKVTVGRSGLSAPHVPTVLVPRGGAHWLHPYTGGLRQTPFAAAALLDEGEPAYRPPSAEALATWQHLGERTDATRESDLCLDGQRRAMDSLVARFARQRRKTGTYDVLGLVTGLHDIVRMGLTRGHCGNDATPRACLGDMPYQVRGNEPPVWIAHRVFSYDMNERR